jgi:selenium-binding protein 1
MKKHLLLCTLTAIAGVAAAVSCGGQGQSPGAPAESASDIFSSSDDVLYVWASDAAHQQPDFVAVVGFKPGTSTYGKVIRIVQVPAPNQLGNEPHHVGLSVDGNTLGTGGLLSVLRGQDEVFFFDVTDAFHPAFKKSDNPPMSAITDEFVSLSNGGFMVTMMGAADGSNPGRVAEYDHHQNRVNEWPLVPPTDGSFNPHGISVNEAENIMVTSDFICPAHTLNIPGGDMADFRGTIRVWDLAGRAITKTIHAGDPMNPPGMMEIRFIPYDWDNRAYAPGTTDGKLYLVDPNNGTATAVYDFNANFAVSGTGGTFPALTSMTKYGDRLFVALEYFGAAGKIVMMNIDDPANPTVLKAIDLGAGSGPHYMRLTKESSPRLVVTDYFLVEDLAPGGVVQADGDHKVHVFNVGFNSFSEDTSFKLNMNTAVAGYTNGVRPHGAVSKRSCGQNCGY